MRSERPAVDMHYPPLLERLQVEAHAGKSHTPYTDNLVDSGSGPRQGPGDPDPT